jgi:predicted transcriptional regulator
MATAKQEVQKVLDTLPEETSLEDIQYHLYVLQRVERGRQDIEAGRVIPQDEVERRMARWLDR